MLCMLSWKGIKFKVVPCEYIRDIVIVSLYLEKKTYNDFQNLPILLLKHVKLDLGLNTYPGGVIAIWV
jgi:hypothetical protein